MSKFLKYRLLHDNKASYYYCQYSLFGFIWFCESFDYGICVFTKLGGTSIENIKNDWIIPSEYKKKNIQIVEVRHSNFLTRLLPKFNICLGK